MHVTSRGFPSFSQPRHWTTSRMSQVSRQMAGFGGAAIN